MAEMEFQQLRATEANPANPPPPFRAAFLKQVTGDPAFKVLTKYTGKKSEYHDWAFSARRARRTTCLLDCCSAYRVGSL